MVAEPLLPEVKAQDGNSIGNSILKKRKKESNSLLIDIELPIELPSWGVASDKRCLGSGLGTARPGVSSARSSYLALAQANVWLRPGPGLALAQARGSGSGSCPALSQLGSGKISRGMFLGSDARSSQHTENYYLRLRVVIQVIKNDVLVGDHPWVLKPGNSRSNTIIKAMKLIIFKASTRAKNSTSTLPRRAFFESKGGCCVCH